MGIGGKEWSWQPRLKTQIVGLTPQDPNTDSGTDTSEPGLGHGHGGHIGKDKRQVNRVQDYIYELVVCICLSMFVTIPE